MTVWFRFGLFVLLSKTTFTLALYIVWWIPGVVFPTSHWRQIGFTTWYLHPFTLHTSIQTVICKYILEYSQPTQALSRRRIWYIVLQREKRKLYCITEIWRRYLPYFWRYNRRKNRSYLPIWMNGTHRWNGTFLERNFFTARWSARTDFLTSGAWVGILLGPLNSSS